MRGKDKPAPGSGGGILGILSLERENPTPCDAPGAAEGFSSLLVFLCSPGKQPRFPGNSMSLSQEFPEGSPLSCPAFP